jgi:hypothetical protein
MAMIRYITELRHQLEMIKGDELNKIENSWKRRRREP